MTIFAFILLFLFTLVDSVQIIEKYRMNNCKNHVPISNAIFLTIGAKNALQCSAECQLELAYRSFGFKTNTKECYLSWASYDSCQQLEANGEANTYMGRNLYTCGNKNWCKTHSLELSSRNGENSVITKMFKSGFLKSNK